MTRVIALELNELDFELVERYAADGHLPTFTKLLRHHDLVKTRAETAQEQLEPWIQWVTAHTGRSFDEHGIFRLGDIVEHELPQVWDVLEEMFGLRVGAISPMNAANRLRDPAFFVPDPWTRTTVAGRWDLKCMSEAIAQAVQDNAHKGASLRSLLQLALGAVPNVRARNLFEYSRLAATSRGRKWRKALFLDLLLSDVFLRHFEISGADYASLFLNGAAHIQHHYMFSSKYYRGPHRNPHWYIGSDEDPVAEVYATYDRILANILKTVPNVRLLICTALSQKANDSFVQYYRPKSHREFIDALGVEDVIDVMPRMSRDFLVELDSVASAKAAENTLSGYLTPSGERAFLVENRGQSLFCMFSYTGDMDQSFYIKSPTRYIDNLPSLVCHVSIENAVHKTTGYLIDTGAPRTGLDTTIPLTELFERTISIWA